MSTVARSAALRSLNLTGTAVVVALILAWQAVVDGGLVELDYLPSPTAVINAAVDAFQDGELVADLTHTLVSTLVAAGIAIAIGVVVGTALGVVAVLRDYTTASIDFFRTVPVTALVPVALLVWGPSTKAEIIVAAYAAVWPVIINASSAIRGVPVQLFDVAGTLRMSRLSTWRKIILPAAMPGILVGARLALVLALVLSIVSEMLINPQGLGWGIIEARNSLQPERLWAYTVVAGMLAYVTNAVLTRAVSIAVPGGSPRTAGGDPW